MKNKIPSSLLAIALLAFCSSARAAEPTNTRPADLKIGIVDMRKAFDSYYKTIAANKAITNELADVKKEIDSMMAEADKARDAMNKAVDRANDMGISADERAKSQNVADEKRAELQGLQTDIDGFEKRENTRLAEKRSQRIDTIVGEIELEVRAMAKEAGYTVVLDKSGETIPGVPIVLYTNGENDMTDALIKDLNASAPPPPADDTQPATPPSDTKPPSTNAPNTK